MRALGQLTERWVGKVKSFIDRLIFNSDSLQNQTGRTVFIFFLDQFLLR